MTIRLLNEASKRDVSEPLIDKKDQEPTIPQDLNKLQRVTSMLRVRQCEKPGIISGGLAKFTSNCQNLDFLDEELSRVHQAFHDKHKKALSRSYTIAGISDVKGTVQ